MLLQALIAILISGSLACLLMAVLSLHHRKNPGMRIFIALLLAISIYAFTYGIELANSTLDGKLSWIRIEYLGIAPLPALWLLLAFYYINRTEWLTWPRIVLLWVIPIVVYGGVLTNPFFHLLYTSVGLDTAGPFPNLAFTRGPIYWLAIGYDFLSVIVSILLLTIQRLNPHRMYRRQVSILLVSSLVTILVVGLYLAGIQPIRDLDINPFAMLLSSLIMGWGLVRYQLIDLSPVAQNLVLRKIQIGVIILGSKNRVVEANPAALNDLGLMVAAQYI